jgi:hypothetical protein
MHNPAQSTSPTAAPKAEKPREQSPRHPRHQPGPLFLSASTCVDRRLGRSIYTFSLRRRPATGSFRQTPCPANGNPEKSGNLSPHCIDRDAVPLCWPKPDPTTRTPNGQFPATRRKRRGQAKAHPTSSYKTGANHPTTVVIRRRAGTLTLSLQLFTFGVTHATNVSAHTFPRRPI